MGDPSAGDDMAPLPGELRAVAERRLETFVRAAQAAGLEPPAVSNLPGEVHRVLAVSGFVAERLARDPASGVELATSGDLARALAPGEHRARVEHALAGVVSSADSETALMCALRRLRAREWVRIAWRDIGGLASLEETVRDTSAFADAAIDAALERLHAWRVARSGEPAGAEGRPLRLVVIALGKLGAEELNFSSDVDLLFAFPEVGETRGAARSISNDEFFLHLGRRLIKVLGASTEDGFVFRVDMRLRPFGASGPLVASFNALEDYYQIHGRDWERYALVRARAVAGDKAAGEALLERLRPFVYRRYLDFGALESLRDMKALIRDEVARKGLEDHVKLGAGGIREAEFVGQAFQMVRGGREPELRTRSILDVYARLGERGYLPPFAVRELGDAYRLLRAVEHRLQQFDDKQRHRLPAEPGERLRLAAGLGFADWESLAARLAQARANVKAHFDQVFGVEDEAAAGDAGGLDALWEGALDAERALEVLAQTGFREPQAGLARIERLRRAYSVRALGERGRRRLRRLMPLVLRAAAAREDPEITLERTLEVIETIARRSSYLALLAERPLGLSQLVQLCGASALIARHMARYPLLLDELLDTRALYAPLERLALERDAEARLARVTPGDTEQEMDCLRQFKQSNVLRVAAADVSGQLDVGAVTGHLSAIAEVALGRVLRLAWRDLEARHGRPRSTRAGERVDAGFCIVAYGKLGSRELGYGSDLDLVFLHDSEGEDQHTEGPAVIDNPVFFVRLAQRIIHLLTTHTAGGVLYAVDARLRPSGSAGLLVSSLASFEAYQLEQAWTWEHQALVRARPVAGARALARRFRRLRLRVLAGERDGEELRARVVEMRNRMRGELGSRSEAIFHLKQDPGGIADIEFVVQYCALRWATRLGPSLRHTDNARLLAGFARAHVLEAGDAVFLAEAHRAYLSRVHALALQERAPIVEIGGKEGGAGGEAGEEKAIAALRRRVCALWERLLGAPPETGGSDA